MTGLSVLGAYIGLDDAKQYVLVMELGDAQQAGAAYMAVAESLGLYVVLGNDELRLIGWGAEPGTGVFLSCDLFDDVDAIAMCRHVVFMGGNSVMQPLPLYFLGRMGRVH